MVVATLSIAIVIWVLTSFKRQLPPIDELFKRIRAVNSLAQRVHSNPIKELLESDKVFWNSFGRKQGLIDRHNNAVCYVQICQHLAKHEGMPKRAVRLVSRRAFWMKIFILFSVLEQVTRLIFKNLPHFCARCINHLYDELSAQADGLIAEYGPENWISYA